MAIEADFMKSLEVHAMVEAILKYYDGLHILVSNAAVPNVNIPFAQSKEGDWDQDLGVGLKSYLICTGAVSDDFS